MFLVPKPGVDQWRIIFDLRELSSYCSEFNMTCETLKTAPFVKTGGLLRPLDPADGFYALGIWEEDKDFFTIYYIGERGRMTCVLMGWSGLSSYFESSHVCSPITSGV
jgi:hypothetical protein